MTRIFVFGSNLAGRHGKGAALYAKKYYDAEYGIGCGRTGNAYAIPTKGYSLEILPLNIIKWHVDNFIEYVKENPSLTYIISAIGCGLAGYKPWQIAPMFYNISFYKNCEFNDLFKEILHIK
jgi:hypothetical protein